MHDVLLVYKQISMQFDEDGNVIIPVDEPMVHTVSCDENQKYRLLQPPERICVLHLITVVSCGMLNIIG